MWGVWRKRWGFRHGDEKQALLRDASGMETKHVCIFEKYFGT
jgi:hypothetical protein